MPSHNALIVFSRTLELTRGVKDPYAGLPWTDVDALSLAMLGDILDQAFTLSRTDILLYRDPKEFSDDFLRRYAGKVVPFDSHGDNVFRQVHHAIACAFQDAYARIIVILENHPLISGQMLQQAFERLSYDDDCIITGSTEEGTLYLVGMKSDHSDLFEPSLQDFPGSTGMLIERACRKNVVLFPGHLLFHIDSGFTLERLRREIELQGTSPATVGARTVKMFGEFDQKYTTRKVLR